MKSKVWKGIERQVALLFGGRRNPLSGSNSGHKTSADVIAVPRWMYIEVKRDIRYNGFWSPLLPILNRGLTACCEVGIWKLKMFRIDTYMKEHRPVILPGIEVKTRENSRTIGLFLKTYRLAMLEKKDGVYCVFRVHNKEGLFCLTDLHGVERLTEWTRKWGKPLLRSQKLSRGPGRKAILKPKPKQSIVYQPAS